MGLFNGRRRPLARIATPCTENWDGMPGDERVRFCAVCRKQVHNVSVLTAAEAHRLIDRTAGEFCARVVLNPDGSVRTPRAHWRHAARWLFAGALGLGAAAAQTAVPKPTPGNLVQLEPAQRTVIQGRVADATGSAIPAARVKLWGAGANAKQGTPLRELQANEAGYFAFANVPAGSYVVTVESPGFKTLEQSVTAKVGESLSFLLKPEIGSMGGSVVETGTRSLFEKLRHPFA